MHFDLLDSRTLSVLCEFSQGAWLCQVYSVFGVKRPVDQQTVNEQRRNCLFHTIHESYRVSFGLYSVQCVRQFCAAFRSVAG